MPIIIAITAGATVQLRVRQCCAITYRIVHAASAAFYWAVIGCLGHAGLCACHWLSAVIHKVHAGIDVVCEKQKYKQVTAHSWH